MIRQGQAEGRLLSAQLVWGTKLSEADNRIRAQDAQLCEQARIIKSHKGRYRSLEAKHLELRRVHEGCPSNGGVPLANHDHAIAAKESECDQLRQQIAGLQEHLAAQQLASDQRHQLLQIEFQRRFDEAVEQARVIAREEGRQEARQATIAEAEMLFANYMTSRQGVGAPLVMEASLSPVPVPEAPADPQIDSLILGLDRLDLGPPMPEEVSMATVDAVGETMQPFEAPAWDHLPVEMELTSSMPEEEGCLTPVDAMGGIEQTSVMEAPALNQPPAEAEASSSSVAAVGAAVLAQGLFSQTAERGLLADALSLGVSPVQQVVEQTPAPEIHTAVGALIAEFEARSRTQASGDQARAVGENSQVLPACERQQTPPGDLPDYVDEDADASASGANGAASGTTASGVTFPPAVIRLRQQRLVQARAEVEDLEREIRRAKKDLKQGVATGRLCGSAVDEREDLLALHESNLSAARQQLAICQSQVDELQRSQGPAT